MNSVCSRLAVAFTCILFLTGQTVLVDHIHAQKLITIRGFVLDGMTNNSVPDAKITLPKNRVTVAENDGKFEFSCLRDDSVMITAIGYCPRLLSVHDLPTDSSMCNVFMQPVVYQLRSVKVIAEKKKTKVEKALNFLSDISHPPLISVKKKHSSANLQKSSRIVSFSLKIYTGKSIGRPLLK